MKKYRLSELMGFDNELFMIANYEAAEGLIPVLNTQEELLQHKVKVAKIFNRYKLCIQDGECDIDFILDNVMSKYSAILQPKISNKEMVQNLLDGKDMSRVLPEPTLLDMLDLPKTEPEDFNDFEELDDSDLPQDPNKDWDYDTDFLDDLDIDPDIDPESDLDPKE